MKKLRNSSDRRAVRLCRYCAGLACTKGKRWNGSSLAPDSTTSTARRPTGTTTSRLEAITKEIPKRKCDRWLGIQPRPLRLVVIRRCLTGIPTGGFFPMVTRIALQRMPREKCDVRARRMARYFKTRVLFSGLLSSVESLPLLLSVRAGSCFQSPR